MDLMPDLDDLRLDTPGLGLDARQPVLCADRSGGEADGGQKEADRFHE